MADDPNLSLSLTFLGTGTSVGVPMIGCECATCKSSDPRDQRLRSSVWMRSPAAHWVVDTGPDFRTQCLRAGIRRVDAALYTHPHMDHVLGFDELRRFCVAEDEEMPIYGRESCLAALQRIFDYAFNGRNRYRGYIKPQARAVHGAFALADTEVTPLEVEHGSVETIGYLFAQGGRKLCAYLPDAKRLPDSTMQQLVDCDTLIIDALRFREHPTHMSIPEALQVVQHLRPRQTWLTHFQCEVMHGRDEPALPVGVRFAYDGLELHWAGH